MLEHPEASHAWRTFNLNPPPRYGGWVNADFEGGWTCCIDQGAYGHPARKLTWLYAAKVSLPSLVWDKAPGEFTREGNGMTREQLVKRGVVQCMSKRQRSATPVPFRDLLIAIARTAKTASPCVLS